MARSRLRIWLYKDNQWNVCFNGSRARGTLWLLQNQSKYTLINKISNTYFFSEDPQIRTHP